MQIVELTLDHFNFYCPVTGKQVLGKNDIQPSAAQLFCYFNELSEFIFANELVQSIYEDCDKEAGQDDDAEDIFDNVISKLDNENYVMFKIINSGIESGIRTDIVYLAFDMNYYH